MSALQTTVLAVGTSALAISAAVILWRELGRGAEARFMQSWRDYLGLGVTLGGLALLLSWLWAGR